MNIRLLGALNEIDRVNFLGRCQARSCSYHELQWALMVLEKVPSLLPVPSHLPSELHPRVKVGRGPRLSLLSCIQLC